MKKSLRTKLLVSFVLVGLLPFVILLAYTLLLSEAKMVNQTIKEQFYKADEVASLIDNHLESMKKDIIFLSSLDLMDDILAEDIDKRISILLSKKSTDFTLDLSYLVVGLDSKIVASSNNNFIQKTFLQYLQLERGSFLVDSKLYISSKIYASFDSTKKLGYLVLEYDLSNLERYLMHQESMHSYITNNDASIHIGSALTLDIKLKKPKESILTDEHVIVYEKLQGVIKDFSLVYAVDKVIALEFLYDFIKFMLYISLPILLLIIYVSLRYSKDIVQPISKLTNATKKITKEQDYSTYLAINSEDEIATLTNSFNEMLKTTSDALENLEIENRLRLKRFTQLIEVFNTIIQTTSENECIEVSMQEIRKITLRDDLSFTKEQSKNSIALYVTDFEKESKVYFGSISLSLESFSDEKERSFYNSIASMIMLQLDRIRLISKTMAVSKAKSAFISNMSHELRTPLNAIIGFSQFLISYEELTDDQLDTVGNIESSAHYLLGMINEILDIAKIEAGKMEAHKENVDLKLIVNNTYQMLKPLADEKNLSLILDIENYTLQTFHTDAKMFQQIITNILSNAIKFTQEGLIEFQLYNDNTNIYVKISDSGIGIKEEDLERLFSDFTQVENVMQKKYKGTGLGLSLSKKMANLLDGDIILSSDGLDKGSEAVFYIKSN